MNRELFLLLGGTAALLLQVAHPLVAAGVDQHSDFRRSPHGRLARTLNTTLAVVFGDSRTAWSAIARINHRHAPVRGRATDGRPYDAREPALLLWVQSTLVLTSLRVYELVMGRLPDRDRQAYWDETKDILVGLGLPRNETPDTIGDLESYERAMLESSVLPDETSRTVARAVLRPYTWVPEPFWWPSDAITAGLLPPSIRRGFGLRFGVGERLIFRGAIVALRFVLPILPRYLRVVPQARRWERR